jgi:hypothetical protein
MRTEDRLLRRQMLRAGRELREEALRGDEGSGLALGSGAGN